MDPVVGLLDGASARRAFLLRSQLDPPWALRLEDEALLTVVTVVRGHAWVLPEEGEAVLLEPGDVGLVRGPAPYVVADDPATPVQVVVGPGEVCSTVDGSPTTMAARGVRRWGNSDTGATQMLCGTYTTATEVSSRLLACLPPVVAVDGGPVRDVVHLLDEEVVRDRPGQQAVLDRLLDLLVIAALREWFARPEAQAPGWYRGHSDPLVGAALGLLHDEPARAWTVESLARACGSSRAALARRFTELIGEPPMAYLTRWRLSLAADLLREPGATVGSVARQVGYSSAFALSAAFKRERGVSPRQHRAASA